MGNKKTEIVDVDELLRLIGHNPKHEYPHGVEDFLSDLLNTPKFLKNYSMDLTEGNLEHLSITIYRNKGVKK